MRFLHTGDLHLDSPFCRVGSMEAEDRRVRQRDLLKNIFSVAEEKECKLMLISGDLFDGGFVSRESADLFCRLVKAFACPVVVSAGNHDPYTNNSFWAKNGLPENLFVFASDKLSIFSFPELSLDVLGYSFTSGVISESPVADAEVIPASDVGVCRLLCAHGDFGVPISRYAPLTESDIDRLGVSFAALGHIHKRESFTTAGGTPVAYCGFAEGRSFDECGEGGVIIGEIEDGKVSFEWQRISEIVYDVSELDVSDISDRAELENKIERFIADNAYSDKTYLRLILCGAFDGGELYDIGAIEKKFSDRLSFLEIKDETIPVPSAEYLERDMTIRGELYRILLPMLNSEDRAERAKAVRALSIGLSAIDGKISR